MTQKKIYTEEELKFRENLNGRLAAIDGKLDNLHDKLSPILALQTTVTAHDRQIQRWKGVNQALGVVLALFMSLIGAMYGKFKHMW